MATAQERLSSYTGGLHLFRQYMREKWAESAAATDEGSALKGIRRRTGQTVQDMREMAAKYLGAPEHDEDFAHIYRHKTRLEMVRISAAVMGIEFCYAAETAFVSPTLLKIGVQHRLMTLIWCLSPAIGFFLTPVLGSMSDRCRLGMGRRRPFILLLSVGLILGLILVPNGKLIGIALGDTYSAPVTPSTSLQQNDTFDVTSSLPPSDAGGGDRGLYGDEGTTPLPDDEDLVSSSTVGSSNSTDSNYHPWGIFFTILGTMLLDFDADACQSPARAYLLDVTLPEEHAVGLSTFTIMAGLGGGTGYAMGAINWDQTLIGRVFGGHVRAVFTLVMFIYFVCVFLTVTSFKEIPLDRLTAANKTFTEKTAGEAIALTSTTSGGLSKGVGMDGEQSSYGATNATVATGDTPATASNGVHAAGYQYLAAESTPLQETSFNQQDPSTSVPASEPPVLTAVETEEPDVTLKQYLLSIVYMPRSLRVLCITNLFCWMSLVSYSLYFTDFVGEAVFGGDPSAPEGSIGRELYEDGVRFGCWGMSLYSVSCACYSAYIESLVKRFGARPVYVCGQLVYSVGMVFMAIFPYKASVIILSTSAGVMYSTLFTMPYLLVANYHDKQAVGFERTKTAAGGDAMAPSEEAGGPSSSGGGGHVRGLGTDVAIVSSMVFLAQFIQALCMGSIVDSVGSTTAIVGVAAVLAFCGAVSATQVVYLDL